MSMKVGRTCGDLNHKLVKESSSNDREDTCEPGFTKRRPKQTEYMGNSVS